MKVTAHIQSTTAEGRKRVYRAPFSSLSAARAFARGPYSMGEKVVIVTPRKVECWEGRTLVSTETL